MNESRSPVRLVRSATLTDQAPYAYASVVEPPVRTIHLAGACSLDADGVTVAPGDIAAQTRQCLANLRTALTDAGAVLTDRGCRLPAGLAGIRSRGHLARR